MNLVGFPHSDTAGSQDRGSFPAIIAAMRVLLRCLIPRHSLSAFVKDFYDLVRHLLVLKSTCRRIYFPHIKKINVGNNFPLQILKNNIR